MFGGIRGDDKPEDRFYGGLEIPPVLGISMPDLQCHAESGDPDPYPEEEDSDKYFPVESYKTKGFMGTWVDDFILCAKAGRSLGVLEKKIWVRGYDSGDESPIRRMWGMKVKLEPIRGSVVYKRDEEEWYKEGAPPNVRKLRLISYHIRATILEIYIKPECVKTFLKEPPITVSNPRPAGQVEEDNGRETIELET